MLRYRTYLAEKKETFASAQVKLLSWLESAGWAVKKGLKIPHATKGDVKLWFKKQAVYASKPSLQFGSARSLHIDPRKYVDPKFSPEKVVNFLYKQGKDLVDHLDNY